MKLNFKEREQVKSAELGDVIILKDGQKFLLVQISTSATPWSLIDLERMQEAFVRETLESIMSIFDDRIERIIKSENLEIREIEKPCQ